MPLPALRRVLPRAFRRVPLPALRRDPLPVLRRAPPRRCPRSHGMSSGPVPSRSPSARPTRSSARAVPADSTSSFSAVWISSAVQPGNARLTADSRYAPPSSTWIVSPGRRLFGRLGAFASGTCTHTSGNPHSSYSHSFPQPNVRGVVHLQHYICNGALPEHHPLVPRQPRAARMQVHRLVRLEDLARLARGVAQPEVHRAEAFDGRAAHVGDGAHQRGQQMRGVLVVGAGGLGHHPGGLGLGLPVLEPAFVVGDVLAGDGHRPAAGELRRRARGACRPHVPRRLRERLPARSWRMGGEGCRLGRVGHRRGVRVMLYLLHHLHLVAPRCVAAVAVRTLVARDRDWDSCSTCSASRRSSRVGLAQLTGRGCDVEPTAAAVERGLSMPSTGPAVLSPPCGRTSFAPLNHTSPASGISEVSMSTPAIVAISANRLCETGMKFLSFLLGCLARADDPPCSAPFRVHDAHYHNIMDELVASFPVFSVDEEPVFAQAIHRDVALDPATPDESGRPPAAPRRPGRAWSGGRRGCCRR